MALLFGGFIGFIGLIIGIFYLLKLFSVTLFYIPGFDHFYSFIMIIIPYVIFFCGYYYLHKKIPLSKSKTAAVAARVLMILGSLLCGVTMILSTLKLFGIHKTFLLTFDEKSQYGWMIQIVILFFTALIVASGDEKEKDWMHKKSANNIAE
jgi:ABC-type multidrug transport system permease subunit